MGVDSVTEITEITATPDGPAPGTLLLGKYRIESTLGVGGYGRVLRAHHLVLDEPVAIKVLRDDIRLDDDNIRRFIREAQAASRLKSEHVAEIRDVGSLGGGKPYIVMELLDGIDLHTMLEREGPLKPAFAAELLLQACHALAEAHSLGIVHRDIKPSNLFLATRPDGSRVLKVLDFGIAKAPDSQMAMTQSQSVLGTPTYMSPEQMRSARTVDARSDIWSLGSVLYELVEGAPPFPAQSFAEICVLVATEQPRPMQRAPELAGIVARCLEKSADDRYQTIAELAVDLGAHVGDVVASSYLPRICAVLGAPQRAPSDAAFNKPSLSHAQTIARPPRRRGLVAAIAGGLVLGGAAAVAFTLTRSPERVVDHHEPAAAPAPVAAPAPAPPVVTSSPAPVAVPPAPVPVPAAAGSAVAEPPHPAKPPPARHKKPPKEHAATGSAAKPPCNPYKSADGC